MNDIKTHLKYVHEGLREAKCEKCGKEFRTHLHLARHIRYVRYGGIHKLS